MGFETPTKLIIFVSRNILNIGEIKKLFLYKISYNRVFYDADVRCIEQIVDIINRFIRGRP